MTGRKTLWDWVQRAQWRTRALKAVERLTVGRKRTGGGCGRVVWRNLEKRIITCVYENVIMKAMTLCGDFNINKNNVS